MRSRVLLVAITVVLLGVLSTDLATAAHLRADERHARAVAAEARRVQAYREHLRPLVERVYDEVQPLQEAVDFYLDPGPDAEQIRQDVFLRSGAHASLAHVRAQLTALPQPPSLRQQARTLNDAAGALVDAANRLERTARADPLGQQRGAESLLGGAVLTWFRAVTAVYGQAALPALPYGGTPPAGARRPSSHGSWIRAADGVCSAAIDSGLALPDLNTARNVVAAGPRYAKLVRSTLSGLQALPAAPADKARLAQGVTPSLRATGRMADGLESLAAAGRAGDLAAIRSAIRMLTTGLRASRQLSHNLDSYGATVCGDFFGVGAGDIPGEQAPAPLNT